MSTADSRLDDLIGIDDFMIVYAPSTGKFILNLPSDSGAMRQPNKRPKSGEVLRGNSRKIWYG
jgi:hypothetical protein